MRYTCGGYLGDANYMKCNSTQLKYEIDEQFKYFSFLPNDKVYYYTENKNETLTTQLGVGTILTFKQPENLVEWVKNNLLLIINQIN